MEYKIIGIFVCLLLIATAVVPVRGTINKKVNLVNNIFENQTSMKFAPGEVIVKLKTNTTFSRYSLASLNQKHQVYSVETVFPNAEGTILDNIYLVHVPMESDILSIIQEYTLCPDVIYAEPNWLGFPCGIPNDANFSSQWYLLNTGQVIWIQRFIGKIPLRIPFRGMSDADIDAPEAWEIETGSPDVVIAIIDTGIDYIHPDLAANIWKNTDEISNNGIDDDENGYIDDVRGWDFSLNNSDPKDELGHGTMCAGVAAAMANNNIGIAGICWNCKLMPVKINLTIFTLKTAAQGIKYAADNGADICSMSFGIPFSFSLKNAIDYAYEKGVFLCAAAGNSDSWKKGYPAAYEHVVAVAATNQYDERCTRKDWGIGYGSNYGDWVDIAAPGSLIYSTMPTYHVFMNDQRNHYTKQKFSQDYDWFYGTSSAAPAVAGVAALLLSQDPSLTPNEVKTLLCKNGDPYYSDKYIGTGRLNAYKALADLNSDIEVDIRGGLRVKAVIRNEGSSDLTDVNWQIQVKGGILGLKNKTVNGTVDIPAGKSIRVHTGILFGLGSIIISVKADIFEKTVPGKQHLIFTMVK